MKSDDKTTAITVYEYGEDAGAGFEGQSQDDVQTPFLQVLQSNSPQCKPEDADRYREDARPGMLLNTVTGELYKEIAFVPAAAERVIVEWRKRTSGGGFVARHPAGGELIARARQKAGKEFGKIPHPDQADHELIDTVYVFGLAGTDNPVPAVLAFTSTKMKVWRAWNTQMKQLLIPAGDRKICPPMFAHSVILKTKPEKNNKGSFFNLSIVPSAGDVRASLLAPNDERYMAARALAELVRSGKAQVAEDTGEAPAEETAF